MEYEVIIHGKVSTKNVDKFKECFEKALTDSESTFRGEYLYLWIYRIRRGKRWYRKLGNLLFLFLMLKCQS